MALDKPSFKDVKDMSLGTGTYYGLQEKQIDIPFMEAGDRFSAIINGFSLNIPYFTDLITTIDGITLAIKSAPDIRDTFTSTPSVSYGYTINSPIPIRIQSDVDGQEITILNPIITKADTSVIPLNVSIVSQLKEYSYLPIKSVGGGDSKTTIELSERLYNPSFPFLNGTFSDPSTTTQPYWNQTGNTTQFFTFSGGVARVERYDVLNPVYVSLGHALHQVNSGRNYTFTFEARGIPDTPPTGSIYSVLGYGVDGQGGTLELTDDTWRTYTYQFTATGLYVTASFLRYPGSQGVEIRNVNITQDGGDYLCKPFLRHYDGTTVTNTLLDFTTPYTVTEEDNVSICCCDQPLTHTEDRATGTTTVNAPFSSINVIAYSNDVTVNGNAITSGTSWGIGANKGEEFSNSVTITGTDYFITTIRKS